MKKILLVYNPFAGNRRFKHVIDDFVEVAQTAGYNVHLLRATDDFARESAIAGLNASYAAVVVAGGDGTANFVVNSLKHHKKNIPLGVLPTGTANGFSNYLKTPKSPREAAEALIKGRVIAADLGLVNGRYFINSGGGGLFNDISHNLTLETNSKRIFGKAAYLMNGIAHLFKIKPFPLKITTPNQTIEEEFSLFIAMNSRISGGFKHMAPKASIDDGKLDFVAFRAASLGELMGILPKLLRGKHLDDRRFLYLCEESIKIVPASNRKIITDVDGEPGPKMPFNITCEMGAQPLIVPAMYDRYPREVLANTLAEYSPLKRKPAPKLQEDLFEVVRKERANDA